VEQVVRLIRSKGVGVYFCSQNPDDVPGNILGQLGNRIQHALRAFTPRDQKAVKAAAETFVANPRIKVSEAITQLAVGEALASTLRDGGVPTPVEQVLVSSPTARIGAITEAERATVRQRSPVGGKYDTAINRESAAEILAKRAESKATEVAAGKDSATSSESSGWGGVIKDALLGTSRRQGMIEAMAKSASRTVGTRIGQQIVRGVLGSIFGGKR
jgi:DNA helicase HerA-like ATPase